MKTAKKFLIPFDEKGNLVSDPIDLEFVRRIPDPSKVTWKENVPFQDRMRVGPVTKPNDYHTSKSSTFCEVTSLSTGKSFPMYMSDLMDVVSSTDVIRGEISGTWAFTRHATKVSIYMLSTDASSW